MGGLVMDYDPIKRQLNESWRKIEEQEQLIKELNDLVSYVEAAPTLQDFLNRIDGMSLERLDDYWKSASFTQTRKAHDREDTSVEEKILTEFLIAVGTLALKQAERLDPRISELQKEYDELTPQREKANKQRLKDTMAAMKARREHNDIERFKAEKKAADAKYDADPAVAKSDILHKKISALTQDLKATGEVNASELLNPVGEFEEKRVNQLKNLWGQMTGQSGPEPKDAEFDVVD
jgi:uncharacterized protein YeeX (DUF496 family)